VKAKATPPKARKGQPAGKAGDEEDEAVLWPLKQMCISILHTIFDAQMSDPESQ